MQDLLALKDEASQILTSEFGIAPEKSTLTIYNSADWKELLKKRPLTPDYIGVYFPADYSAHVEGYTKASKVVMFHEYFGYGLFCEHTRFGQYQQKLCQRLQSEERELGADPNNPEEFLSNPTIEELLTLQSETDPIEEGFAQWIEWYLSKQTGNLEAFKETRKLMSEIDNEGLNTFLKCYYDYGEHALLYKCGFPKHYNADILKGTLQTMFQFDFNSINFALVFGSRKPRSDIDMLMVSDRIRSRDYDWLDLSSITKERFEDLASKLDISVTDPIFTGEFVCGDRNYFEQAKKKMLETPITREAIQHNRYHAEIAKATGLKCEEGSKNRRAALSYNKSYLLNAKELEQGRKALTLIELMKRYPEEFSEFTS